ncbi:MAG: hypothetical protein WBV69_08555 [Candidatus Sulfotelmatobacter sp.]
MFRTLCCTFPKYARLRWQCLFLFLLPMATAIGQLGLSGAVAQSTSTPTQATASGTVPPNPINELDCNGWSKTYQTVRKHAGDLCTDPIKVVNGSGKRFTDNGWYVGHDEPSVKFISSAPSSGNTMTYVVRVPVDPKQSPNLSLSVTHYGQLSVAPWFGLPMCDTNSYPQNPCTPDSDSNSGSGSDPHAAGSAFMELQLYPPGYTPFIDNESCSPTQWCAALTIDSLECTYGFGNCNNDCVEPVNFAYLQTNGVPAGPPSPQLANINTFLPNRYTLMINPGDLLVVSITDPPRGFTATIRDLTTGQTGSMTASAANGFMNTSISSCAGTPFTFHAEYNTASINNRVPWAALEGGVLMEEEIGHSEVCQSLINRDPTSFSYPGGQSFSDNETFDTCVGGSEGPGQVGEGPCDPTTGICQNAETQGPAGPQACPTDQSDSGALCEFADGWCFPKGKRYVTIDGIKIPAFSANNQCFADRYQNGDLDFDGVSYQPNGWPDGSWGHPTPFEVIGPYDAQGQPYPQVQFETDINGSAFLCNTSTGQGCVVPPTDANFYPFWSLSQHSFAPFSTPGLAAGWQRTSCAWDFGNVLPQTIKDFGKDAQYGSPDLSWYGGTSISAPMPNPEFSGPCKGT